MIHPHYQNIFTLPFIYFWINIADLILLSIFGNAYLFHHAHLLLKEVGSSIQQQVLLRIQHKKRGFWRWSSFRQYQPPWLLMIWLIEYFRPKLMKQFTIYSKSNCLPWFYWFLLYLLEYIVKDKFNVFVKHPYSLIQRSSQNTKVRVLLKWYICAAHQ